MFCLCLLLAAAAPRAHANATASPAQLSAVETPQGNIVAGGENRIPGGSGTPVRLLPPRSHTRALLGALDARFLVLAAATPQRSVAEIKPKPSTAGERPSSTGGSQPGELPRLARSSAPVEIVDGPRQGQTGYVHFFLLATPDGEAEIQVGVELLDGTIAWSFPEAGVTTMPFIRAGTIEVAGKAYGVEHLYGLRPFPDAESMAALRMELPGRITPLLEGRTPYCNPFLRPQTLCLSCLGFVLEALFPGRMPGSPAIPADFPRTKSRLYYTTDDLLLYLTGFHEIDTPEARARRIEALRLPSYLEEELWQLVEAFDMKDTAAGVDLGRLKNSSGKPPAAGRSYTRTPPPRKRL